MKLLLSHVGRSILRIRYRLLVIAMICASTFGVLVGAYSAIGSLFSTVEGIQIDAKIADLELLFAADDEKNLPDFSDLPGVSHVNHRLMMPGQVNLMGKDTVSGLLLAARPQQFREMNKLRLLDGRLPETADPYGVALERNCAQHYGKTIGETFPFKVGHAEYKLTVRGIVESPEYLIAPLNPSVYVPTNGSLCVFFGAASLMHESLGFPATNSLLIHFAPGADAVALKAQVLERAHTRLSVDYALSRHEQFSQKFLELDLNTFKVFLPAVVIIFALSSTLVVFFLMYQWIKEERPLIAMLLTLGYSQRQIVVAYLLPAVVILLLALVMGMFVALGDMWVFGANYARAIGMPEPTLRFIPCQIVLAVGVLSVTIGLGMWLPLRSLTKVAPIDALRDASALATDRESEILVRAAQRIGGPFWLKYALRNLARSWCVSLVSVIAVAASLGITISFYISLTSMERTAISSFAADRWQAVVDLDAPWWSDEVRRLEQAVPGSSWSTFVKGGAQIVSGQRLDNAYLIGIDSEDGVRHPNLIAGRMINPDDGDAVVIERRLAVDHGLQVGSAVQLKVRGETYSAKVVGILSGAVPGELIAPRAFAQRVLALEDQFTGAFMRTPDWSAERGAALYQARGVVRVTSKDEIIAAILSISGHIWIIIHLSALMSIGVSALFILTSIAFTIIGRRGEYGTLRILGYRDASVTRIVLAEAAIMALLAAAISIPLGFALGDVLNNRLAHVWFKINTQPAASDFLRVVVPALMFVPLAAWPAIKNVFRIHPVQIIKERKFG